MGANLGPTWRPRRFQDEPEAKKKADKNGKKSRFMLGAAQSSKIRPKMTLQTLILQGFRGHLGRIFKDFSKDFLGYASAASEASGATSRQTQHEAAGSLEQITRFPFLIKTGFSEEIWSRLLVTLLFS